MAPMSHASTRPQHIQATASESHVSWHPSTMVPMSHNARPWYHTNHGPCEPHKSWCHIRHSTTQTTASVSHGARAPISLDAVLASFFSCPESRGNYNQESPTLVSRTRTARTAQPLGFTLSSCPLPSAHAGLKSMFASRLPPAFL